MSKKKQRLVSAHKLHKKSIRKLAYPVNNSDLIFTASKDKSIKLTDLKHETSILTLEDAHEYGRFVQLTLFFLFLYLKIKLIYDVKCAHKLSNHYR